ncbi:MAG: hypothetical protein ACOYN0_09980 [Phycisphaerales bacterium]
MNARSLLAVLSAGLLCGCAPKTTTRITVADLEETTSVIADKLRGSDLLASRGPDSPPMIVAIHKVENLTSDIIPDGDRWWMMQRVRASQPILTLSRDKNIRFVIPAEHLRQGLERGTLEAGFAADRAPTHEMSATFLSTTRAAGKNRTDAYLCEYRITDLATGGLAWTEIFEFKRAAFGKGYD